MLASLLTIASLYLAPAVVRASPCVAFDINWNLLGFGLNGKDWNAGTQDQWSSGSAADITTSGRPPFDGANTTCYLSQFTNAIYVMNGDKSSPSSVHIYDATAKSWTTQSVTTGSFDPSSFDAILDHDTNVVYALSHGEVFSLDMGLLKAANSSALAWNDVQKAPYDASYQPVMALAQNHIHFLNVPGVPQGQADIFVIHFSYFQPQPQAYPLADGSAFPSSFGQATSFFQAEGVQQEFAFIPADSSATYVVNVETNTTQALAGPATKDAQATYFAGLTSLVQLDSTGTVSWLPYVQNDTNANKAAQWSKVAALASVAPATTAGAGSSASAGAGATGSVGPKASGSGASSSAGPKASANPQNTGAENGAVGVQVQRGLVGAVLLGALAVLV
ncbi:hypothetical protein DENSPDRAFT_881726 [Dentipellis sp. KUC8613]|nr:hypothetical protein DENSPDRAFT_881726 [Dentipellis sp. KUC8613]